MYQAPVSQILLAMRSAGGFESSDVSFDDAKTIVEEAGRYAAERIAPLNSVGDRNAAKLVDGEVRTPPGWRELYQDWYGNGWNSLTGPAEFGGQGLPMTLAVACTELWNSAAISFALCPLLTTGAIEAIAAHAAPELKERYLPKMVAGEWTGTMNLTEPQSGSDLSDLRCKATRHGDGTYRISGTKIYITYGEHDFSSNIVHLVLARLDDAPAGTRGISLFIVPKFLPDGTRNDLRCHSLEHKLGIHGSPTCTMIYGDTGGAVGWLVGEENRGLACMFTMMNNARLLVGVQGVALAERAMQAAILYAKDRKQGRVAGESVSTTIIHHPDVKRMLLEMRAKTAAARMLCMATAGAIDMSLRGGDETERKRANSKASLLTPLAKAYSTDIAVEVTSSAVQVHGGMGYVEETGVAQFYRDARILPIYEGTNGIQAMDLVTRKIGLDNGATLAATLSASQQQLAPLIGEDVAAQAVSDVAELAKSFHGTTPVAHGAATAFLRAMAAVVSGGYLAAASALDHSNEADSNARYFCTSEMASAIAAAKAAMAGASVVAKAQFD